MVRANNRTGRGLSRVRAGYLGPRPCMRVFEQFSRWNCLKLNSRPISGDPRKPVVTRGQMFFMAHANRGMRVSGRGELKG